MRWVFLVSVAPPPTGIGQYWAATVLPSAYSTEAGARAAAHGHYASETGTDWPADGLPPHYGIARVPVDPSP